MRRREVILCSIVAVFVILIGSVAASCYFYFDSQSEQVTTAYSYTRAYTSDVSETHEQHTQSKLIDMRDSIFSRAEQMLEQTDAYTEFTGQSETQQTQADIPEDHILLNSKAKGDCRTLTGNVLATYILIDDPQSSWTDEDIKEFISVHESVADGLQDDAESYGVELRMQNKYYRCKVDIVLDRASGNEGVTKVLKAVAFPEKSEVSQMLKEENSVNEAPVIFVVNRRGRSYAMSQRSATGFEHIMLYWCGDSVRHEMLHLFGAKDYYYPEKVERIAEKYYPDSVMLICGNGSIDNLTAYLIGWTENLSAQSAALLSETAYLTDDYMKSANEQELSSGNGTLEMKTGTYTGEYVDGIPHGQGRFEWPSGNTYDGAWQFGIRSGYGTLINKQTGYKYEGYWKNDKMNGQGRIEWSSGDVYVGEFEDGNITGYGTIKWKQKGSSYTGYWKNGKMHGEGTYTKADGTTQYGTWEEDRFID